MDFLECTVYQGYAAVRQKSPCSDKNLQKSSLKETVVKKPLDEHQRIKIGGVPPQGTNKKLNLSLVIFVHREKDQG